jgi:hypothetical protein
LKRVAAVNSSAIGSALFRSSGIPQHSHWRFSAGRAESLMAMKSFVGLTVSIAQNFYLFHLAIVFFRGGKKLQQPGFEQLIRLGRFFEKFPAPRT